MGTKSPPRPKPDNADADSVRSAVSDVQLPPALERLATLLEKREHVLAAPAGDDELARDALAATKGIFDLGELGVRGRGSWATCCVVPNWSHPLTLRSKCY